jgi:hypothetical protein
MKRLMAATVAAFALSGCASIINGQTQAVTIQSVPDGAALTVTNSAGQKIHTGTAPATLTLKRGAGYFKSESYTVSFSKDGFDAKELTITATMSGWYIGNILAGGLIGMLAVDPVTGGMYVFPDQVNATLDATKAAASSAVEASIKIVSTANLTAEQMTLARLVSVAK